MRVRTVVKVALREVEWKKVGTPAAGLYLLECKRIFVSLQNGSWEFADPV